MNKRFDMPYPYGWFQVALSQDLAAGESRPLRYFGEEMVLFRTEDGQAKILDAYCPHMGGHLGYGIRKEPGQGGEVRGDTIVCPFHGWRFNGEGQCEEIPYATHMPPRVADKQCVMKSWPVQERNQMIWMWYHPHNEPPHYEVEAVEEFDPENGEWGEMEIHTFKVKTHCQEMAENGADPAHFRYVHGVAEFPASSMGFDGGHRRQGKVDAPMETPRGVVDGSIEFVCNGPGQSYTRFSGICETVEMGNVTPIDEEYVEYNAIFIQPRADEESASAGVARAIIKDICRQIEEDSIIWEHKLYREKPMLCDGDGPIAKFRKWYSQFYVE
ncbi:MAG: Rieske 2Fe-2S domain-containing protein [Gammaproteobacteria bacterium]|nr:Rieske 2Fe-2S domain-containing protein [Gammaproteobacteria bacterium]